MERARLDNAKAYVSNENDNSAARPTTDIRGDELKTFAERVVLQLKTYIANNELYS